MKSTKIEFQIELTFTGDLDADQEAHLVEMAHKCPVNRTLIGPIRIGVNQDGATEERSRAG